LNSNVRVAYIGAIVVAGLILAGSHGKVMGAAQPADGKTIFLLNCAACHRPNGAGGGPYPPLAGNPDVNAVDSAGLIQTVLNGRTGPITVNGTQYGGNMPSWRELSNEEIAAVLTYVRSAWQNSAPAVSADQVAAARAPTAMSGEALFAAHCATCHQLSGQGTDAYPPLAANPVVTAADPGNMIGVIVNGRTGPLTVNGKTFNSQMPTWKGQLSNADIASVATYVRSAWGNAASPVTEQEVATAGVPVSVQVGASVYAKNCAACHGAGGAGGIGPALAGNPHVNIDNPHAMLITIVLGRNLMPSWRGQLSAGDIAAVATYVRSSWGNNVPAVTVQEVMAIK
jgi:cbb3-type cytochrome c oxidase subunit III